MFPRLALKAPGTLRKLPVSEQPEANVVEEPDDEGTEPELFEAEDSKESPEDQV